MLEHFDQIIATEESRWLTGRASTPNEETTVVSAPVPGSIPSSPSLTDLLRFELLTSKGHQCQKHFEKMLEDFDIPCLIKKKSDFCLYISPCLSCLKDTKNINFYFKALKL